MRLSPIYVPYLPVPYLPYLCVSPIYEFVKLKVRNIYIFYLLVMWYFSLSTSSILKATHRVTVPAEAAAHVGIAAGEAQEPGGGTIYWIIGTWNIGTDA